MTPEEIIKYFDQKFKSHEELLEEKIGNTNDRLDIIIKQNEIRNHRIETIEDEVKLTDTKLSNRALFCQLMQEQKQNTTIRNRWIIGIVVFIFCAYIGWFTKRSTEKIPIELFYQKTDSTLHVPRLYFEDKRGSLMEIPAKREVAIDYFNIKKR